MVLNARCGCVGVNDVGGRRRIRTFVDSGVLIAAARGNDEQSERALRILDDPAREFVSSEFVKLECLPKCIFHGRFSEAEFYNEFFSNVTIVPFTAELVELAFCKAKEYGLSAVDALHVAAAIKGEADELVTTERTSSPIHRTTSVKVRTIHPTGD